MKPPNQPSSSNPNEQIEAERGGTLTRATGPILENGCDESSTPPSGSVNRGGEGNQSTCTPAVNGVHLDLAPWEDQEQCEVPGVQNGLTTQNHPLVNGNHRLEPLNSTRLVPPRRARFRGNGELLSEIGLYSVYGMLLGKAPRSASLNAYIAYWGCTSEI